MAKGREVSFPPQAPLIYLVNPWQQFWEQIKLLLLPVLLFLRINTPEK